MYFDRVKYSATQLSATAFSVTVVSGFEELPTTAIRASLYIIDSSGNYAQVDGTRSGTQININFIYASSLANNSMPNFGSGTTIYSTVGGELLKDSVGTGAILHIGQSNGMGTEDNSSGPLDYTDGRIVQWSRTNNGFILAQDPLEHYVAADAGSVGMSMTFAKDLLRYENHKQICIIPGCEGSTGFAEGQWVPDTGYLYNNAVTLVNNFLAENENNYLIAIVWSLGEDDSFGGRQTTFEASFDNACTSLREDFVGNLRQSDMSRVPIICTSMTTQWVTNFGQGAPTVQAILQDIGNRIVYSSNVDSTGATTQAELSEIHFDTPGYRLMGSRLYAALQVARANVTAGSPQGSVAVTLSDFTSAASGEIPIQGTVSETLGDFTSSAAGSVTTQNFTGTVNETLGDFTSSASGTVSESVAVEMLFNRGVGQTTGATLTWANQGTLGSSHDATQNVAGSQPTFDGSGNVSFDGVNDHLSLPLDTLNTAAGFSIMAMINTTNPEGVIVGGSNFAFYLGNGGKLRSFSNGAGNLVESAASVNTGNWVKVYVTVNGANNQQTIYINESSAGSVTSGTFSTAQLYADIGQYNNGSLPFDGDIGYMAFERSVLSLADMNAITAGW